MATPVPAASSPVEEKVAAPAEQRRVDEYSGAPRDDPNYVELAIANPPVPDDLLNFASIGDCTAAAPPIRNCATGSPPATQAFAMDRPASPAGFDHATQDTSHLSTGPP